MTHQTEENEELTSRLSCNRISVNNIGNLGNSCDSRSGSRDSIHDEGYAASGSVSGSALGSAVADNCIAQILATTVLKARAVADFPGKVISYYLYISYSMYTSMLMCAFTYTCVCLLCQLEN